MIENYIFDKKISVSEKSKILNNFTWENNTVSQIGAVEFFSMFVKDELNFTVVDIGAQSGAFSLMSKFFKNTYWYSFEPDPDNFECLIQNINLNEITNIHPLNLAINNINGKTDLRICVNHRGLNTLGENLTRFSENESYIYEVETKTLDSLFEYKKIDLIKIDTEGCEYNILQGAKSVIKKYKPFIFMEYSDINLAQFNHTISDLNNLIHELNYQIVSIFDDNILIKHI